MAAAITPGTFRQPPCSSWYAIRRITVRAVRWVGKVTGLGAIVTGCRSTTFSMPSSIDVLCTQPLPLCMLDGVDPGYAPHGGDANAKAMPLQLLIETMP